MGNIKDYLVYFWKGTDKLLLFLCLLASSAGVLMVTSATWHTMKEGALLPRDTIALIAAVLIGLAIAMVISLIDIDIFAKSWYIWGSLGIILMVIVLLFGEAPSNRADARTWINLGFFLFQPSELVKIFFVTTFATHLDAVRDELNRVRNVALLVLHALIPFILVAISGDDGSALVFLFIAFAMLFIAGIKWQYIVGVFALAAAAIPLLWFQLNDFQKQRFIVIVDPEKYPATAYQQNLGLQALSNGGLLGKGLFKGPYTQAGAVPVSESDMIFTVIGEELGVLGCIAAIALIGLVIFRIIRDAKTESIEAIFAMSAYGKLLIVSGCLSQRYGEELYKEMPEVEFTQVLDETHNYIVLYFDNEVDWLQAQTLFDIHPVRLMSTKNGENNINGNKVGVGRVLRGVDVINRLLRENSSALKTRKNK